MRRLVVFSSIGFVLFFLSFPPPVVSAESGSRSLTVRQKQPVAVGERRVALIIGNSSYLEAALKNPVNDADAMASVLRDTGFDVIVYKNADRRKMFAAIKEFGLKLKKSDVGLFYYAGHGVQIDSANYLLPVDLKGSDLQDSDDLRHSAFPLNELMDRMRDASTNNIIVLDACRDNPFLARLSRSSSKGLTKITTPASTSILYSTDPGNTASDGVSGDNGVFTNRLVEAIQKGGLELVEVMREVAVNVSKDTNGAQRPIFDGVLSSKFYFRPSENTTKQATSSEPAGSSSSLTVDPKVLEIRYWESAEKSGNPYDYQSYLKKYPSGDFADLARNRLEQIKVKKAEVEKASEQKAPPERVAARTVDSGALEMRYWESAEKAGTAVGYQSYLKKFPSGDFAELARDRLEQINAQKGQDSSKTGNQVVASLPPDKVTQKEAGKEKIASLLISELTVTDESTGLTWVRDANILGKKNFNNVTSVINRLNRTEYAGFDNWRLPHDTEYYKLHNTLEAEAKKTNSTVLQMINKVFKNYPDWGVWVFAREPSTPRFGGNGAYTYDLSDGSSREVERDTTINFYMVREAVK
jgi:hypothetical protein